MSLEPLPRKMSVHVPDYVLVMEHCVCVFVCVCVIRMELMDYLDSIDCSLEDFQSMLYGKPFGIDFDAIEVK